MSRTVDLSTSYFQDFHLMNKLPAKNEVSLTINVNVGFWMPSSDKVDNAKIKFSISFKDATNDPILFDLLFIFMSNSIKKRLAKLLMNVYLKHMRLFIRISRK